MREVVLEWLVLRGTSNNRWDPGRSTGMTRHGEERSRSTLHTLGCGGKQEMQDGRGWGWECWEVRRGGWAEPGVKGLYALLRRLGPMKWVLGSRGDMCLFLCVWSFIFILEKEWDRQVHAAGLVEMEGWVIEECDWRWGGSQNHLGNKWWKHRLQKS